MLESCENAECFDKLISMRISPEQLLSEHASVAKGRRAPVRPLDGVLFELLASRNAEGAEPPAAEGLAPSGPVPSPPSAPRAVGGDIPSEDATAEAGASLEMSSQPLEMSRGYEVLLRMLEHPDGLRQLEGCGWVQGELAAWQAHRCAQYATALEQQLVAALKSEPTHAEAHACTCALVPPHLYAALGATQQGCELLHGAGILAQACQELTQAQAPPLQRRAALWAVAHACSCSCGFAFVVGQVRPRLVEEIVRPESNPCTQAATFRAQVRPRLVDEIVRLAQGAPCLSLRGACVFALGLLGGSGPEARRQLGTLGWDCPDHPGAAIALPRDPAQVLRISDAPPRGWDGSEPPLPPLPAAAELAQLPQLKELLAHVGALANQVTQREAHQAICKAKGSTPELFAHPAVFMQLHAVMALYRLKLPVRRFLHDVLDAGAQAFAPPNSRARCRPLTVGLSSGAVVSGAL